MACQPTLHLALQHHRAGRLDEAERLYRQALKVDPANADAHHLLGMIELSRGRANEAIEHIAQAIAQRPAVAEFHQHLGAVYQALGRSDESAASCREAVRLAPGSAAAHNELGNALRELGEFAEAEACYRMAVRFDPQLAVAHNNLGSVLEDQERLIEAMASFREAARLAPGIAEIQFNLGNCYRAQNLRSEAIAAYCRAIAIRPSFATAHHLVGVLLQSEQRYAEAAECHRQALRWQPDFVEAHNALGVALQYLDQVEESKACYHRVIQIEPQDRVAMYNLATVLHLEGRYREAESLYQDVIERLEADNVAAGCSPCGQRHATNTPADYRPVLDVKLVRAEAQLCRGMILLAEGRFAEGWEGFEHRLHCTTSAHPRHTQPGWDGTDLPGRTLLVHAEYGLGDALQFVRYLPLVRRRAARMRILFEVDARLIPLLTLAGFEGLLPRGETSPACDAQVPLMSLPRVFGTTLATIPCDIPYLRVDPQRAANWRSRLADVEGLKVGIHWQGNPTYIDDRHRSVRLERFEPLARVRGVRLISLQKGAGCEQLAHVRDRFEVLELEGLDAEGGAFMDTAAAIDNLDLLITSDSAIAHVAGALGAPVWLILSSACDWRWLLERAESPWYPTMRLFRQERLDEWDGVFERMALELERRVAGAGRQG
jgi:tetratricopeptide (TPR) repeat protein